MRDHINIKHINLCKKNSRFILICCLLKDLVWDVKPFHSLKRSSEEKNKRIKEYLKNNKKKWETCSTRTKNEYLKNHQCTVGDQIKYQKKFFLLENKFLSFLYQFITFCASLSEHLTEKYNILCHKIVFVKVEIHIHINIVTV